MNDILNEVDILTDDLSSKRLQICKRCPLYTENKVTGPICSPYLYINLKTGDISYKYKEGYIKGCGCHIT
jgi:hypothetical protein